MTGIWESGRLGIGTEKTKNSSLDMLRSVAPCASCVPLVNHVITTQVNKPIKCKVINVSILVLVTLISNLSGVIIIILAPSLLLGSVTRTMEYYDQRRL